jgi:hypothetical protein
MSHLALFKHETQAIKNPPPTFQTLSLGTWVNEAILEQAVSCPPRRDIPQRSTA